MPASIRSRWRHLPIVLLASMFILPTIGDSIKYPNLGYCFDNRLFLGSGSEGDLMSDCMEMLFLPALAVGAVCGFVSASIGKRKGYSYGAFFALGLFLGVVGLIISLVVQDKGNQASDAADALLKYKQLLDLGAITQEEFEVKKSEFLYLSSRNSEMPHVPVLYVEEEDSWKGYWVCPDCGKNWYVKGYESGACCGNEECDCMVVLDR
ncbi:SHOCT domain-containing protein [Eggerthella sp. NSJ-70]|uniref:SHOCT domain-containing protein n=2 Tax=Eggerthella hominis TaxID=2763043 RepID=A0ABR7BQ60_9ACTN|nr:SHOCT domain-containing protein [Eggerthella hominis]